MWIWVLPVSIEYTSPLVMWKVIWWRSAERVRKTVMVRLSGSEAGVIVGFPMGWLSSNGGQSEKFQIFLRCRCCYIIYGEYWCFCFGPSPVSGG